MEATGHLVATVAELAAGVEHGEHHLGRGHVFVFRVIVDLNATAVVADLDPTVVTNRDLDQGAVPGHRLVDGVVDDLPDEVMQSGRTGRPDVHRGSTADRFETFEDLDRIRPVGRV